MPPAVPALLPVLLLHLLPILLLLLPSLPQRKLRLPPLAKPQPTKAPFIRLVSSSMLMMLPWIRSNPAIQAELDAKGQELGVTFDYADYTKNGQADSTTLNQIASDLVADDVDVIIPIATPAALIMQTATEENQIPVVFSAVSDPVSAGLVESLDAPGSNVTGTSDALNVEAVIDLMLAANPDMKKLGLLYDQGQDSSKSAIASAEAYCQEKGIEVVEKTGTTNDEIALAADALIAAGVDAVFTPTDNTVMTAELAIYEKFVDAKIPHYAGADSFALNGAFCGYGVNYAHPGHRYCRHRGGYSGERRRPRCHSCTDYVQRHCNGQHRDRGSHWS